MAAKTGKRVFAGYYMRYDGKPIYVIRVVQDIDTGEEIVICKDASFQKEGNENYYTITKASFCQQVKVDGALCDKYVRQTRRELNPEIIKEVYEDGFPEPKRKPFTYKDDEYQPRNIRHSETYLEYAKDICENYRLDLRRCKLIKERRQYIGVDNREEYLAMCEDLTFLRQSMKIMLDKHLEIFNTRFAKGLSIRKSAEELRVNRGVIERRQMALYEAFAQLLQARDQADGMCRIKNHNES